LELEQTLGKLIQGSGLFNVPQSSTPPDDFDDNENFEPISQARIGGNLRNLENFLIKGDLRRCVICNSEYSHGDGGCGSNLPRCCTVGAVCAKVASPSTS
jgi:hypothetical protein